MAALTGTVAAQTSPASTALDASLKGAVERKDIPGVVALVTDKKGVIYEGAFGVADVSTGRPLKTDALFRIASMTKPITSLALMQLVEQGKISLDDYAEEYLPELRNPMVVTSLDAKSGDYQLRPASKPAAVRNFLTIWRDFKPKAGEVYAFGGPMLFDPGERWHYSTSTNVVGQLVEVISGQKLAGYLHDHIFVPLKMNDTSYNVPEAKAPRLAAQQQRDGANMDGPIMLQIPPMVGLTVANPIGGGGLAATADDYRSRPQHRRHDHDAVSALR
jgi:methyl acetate hydrolase